ncbi:FAD-dependent thiol oxidase [Neolentinus lepideus HHB14362 ss-1]|uniref:Sulfhydryl oxidase n=1 Tax=Neolentinus lepideus HHB14362 ss-1 TaxID=1314782 RepID=A0A165SIZ8_9AGAM|nr:FAD-dependent thiol oxidase [Neolentinus lepideus HHB14362 ss-1]
MTSDTTQPNDRNNATGKLPPGMVLGPDGKPCKICTAFRNWKPAEGQQAQNRKQAQDAKAAAVMAAAASGTSSQARPDVRPENCPPDVEVLGRSTWVFLHTTAAYYPDKPSPTQRANMLNLLHALPVLYPCSHCASHLGEEMQVYPPDVSGRIPLSRWLCERHNEVNERLGKEKFDCAKTDERWKDGPSDGSCD